MAAGTPNVLLPWDNAVIFQRNLKLYDGPLASWTAWVVPTTMTVAQAAKIVKRRVPKGAVNAGHWTRKALLRK